MRLEMYINRSLYYRSNHIANCIKHSRVFLLCFILLSFCVKAQINLVLNPSFEQLDSCGNNIIYADVAPFWKNITPSPCASYILNTCCTNTTYCGVPSYNGGSGLNSYQWPRTGNGHLAQCVYSTPSSPTFYRNYRYYTTGKLLAKLIKGQSYCGKVYLNLDNVSPYKINQYGIYLDDGSISSGVIACNIIPNVNPQIANNPSVFMSDTLGWMKIQGVFVANGTEDHITIGNFKSDALTSGIATGFLTNYFTALYNIDDISIIPIEIKAFAGNDATICLGDSIVLGRPQETGIECEWYKPGNPVPFSSNSSLHFKADSVGTYTFIQRMDNCKISFDTVTVKVIQDCNTTLQIPNVFTPNEDGVNDAWYFEIKNASNVRYSIYNRWGNLVKDSDLAAHTFVQWDGRTTAGEACSAGVYYFVLSYTDSKGEAQKKNGYVTLIK